MGASFTTSAANAIVFSNRKSQVPTSMDDVPYKTVTYDGTNRLYIRCLRARGEDAPDPNVILIHCYGNRESTTDGAFISGMTKVAKRLQERLSDDVHLALVVFDYPGYGRSDGNETNEENVCVALEKVFEFALDRFRAPGTRFLLWGRSIGTVPVCRLTQKVCDRNDGAKIDGVILESGIASTWYVRFGVHLEHVFNNSASIERSRRWPSTLIIHGLNDGVVYAESSRELARLVEGKHRQSTNRISHYYYDRLHLLPNKGHDDLSFKWETVEFRALVNWMTIVLTLLELGV